MFHCPLGKELNFRRVGPPCRCWHSHSSPFGRTKPMRRRLILIALLISAAFFLARPLALDEDFIRREFVVWNVGQGLWATWIENNVCLHFDMGGERAPWAAILGSCAQRDNQVSFSHWDWDHVGLTSRAKSQLKNLCLRKRPSGTASDKKSRLIDRLPACALGMDALVRDLSRRSSLTSTSNDSSRILMVDETALLPGDSTRKQEKIWAATNALKPVRILVLGHHGSRTSTSDELLRRLPSLRVGIASARKAKYGHPHAEVTARVQRKGAPVLSTEDWGTLRWQLPQN